VSSIRRSSSTILSTMNMTNWRSVAAAVDDTTAVRSTWQDLLFIKHWQIDTVAAGFPAYTSYLYNTSTSRPRGDSCGHRRVRNQICSRAIPGSTTSWLRLTICLITVSLVGKETRFRPRNCTSSTCQHFRQLCYGNYSIRLTLWRLSPMQSL
jgi:hypothetical protein